MNIFKFFSFSNPYYWIVMITILLICAILIKYSSNIIGWFGELWTKKELKKLPKETYTILNDIMLNEDGHTHQIDHIVVSKYGIFVIETKQFNGYITGDKYDKKWVRHFKGNKKMYYTNPVRQNYGHVKAISELLHIEDYKVFNKVCISSNAKINIKDDGEVSLLHQLSEDIMAINKEIIEDPKTIVKNILEKNIKDKKERKKHINYVNNHKDTIQENMCPKCGGKLVIRNGKYGDFYGCENYPKCKYTKKI